MIDQQLEISHFTFVHKIISLLSHVVLLRCNSYNPVETEREIVLHQSMMQTLAMSEITMANIDIKTLAYILSWFAHLGQINENTNQLLDFYIDTLQIIPFVTSRKDIMHMMYAMILMHRYDIEVWIELINNLSQVSSTYPLNNEEYYKF